MPAAPSFHPAVRYDPPAAWRPAPDPAPDSLADLAERLRFSGPRALDDAEALRLTCGASDADVAALLDEFGSLPEVLAAPRAALERRVSPARATRLALAHDLARRLLEAPLRQRSTLSGWTAVATYLRGVLEGLPREQFRVLFLDKKNQLIRDEVMGEGTVDHAPVYPREVLRRALVSHPAEAAQDIYVAQVARELGHYLPVDEGLVLVGEGDPFGYVDAADQARTLLGVFAPQVVLGDVERDPGQQGLGVAPVDGILGQAQEGLLGEILGDFPPEAAGEKGDHPGRVGSVERGDGGGPF